MTKDFFTEIDYQGEDFRGLDLPGEVVEDVIFDQCQFKRCNFSEARFVRCQFRKCQFMHSDLSLIKIPKTSFVSCTFSDCRLVGVDWVEADWKASRLGKPLSFERCTLNYGLFIGLKLEKMILKRCSIMHADFTDAVLTGATFSFSQLDETRFSHTDLSDTDFSNASGYAIGAHENILKGTRFSLPEAMRLLLYLDIILVDDEESGE